MMIAPDVIMRCFASHDAPKHTLVPKGPRACPGQGRQCTRGTPVKIKASGGEPGGPPPPPKDKISHTHTTSDAPLQTGATTVLVPSTVTVDLDPDTCGPSLLTSSVVTVRAQPPQSMERVKVAVALWTVRAALTLWRWRW